MHRPLAVGGRQHGGHPGQAGADGEDLRRGPTPPPGGMGEAKERLGVGGHGAADVDEQDEASCPGLPVDIADGGQLATGRHHSSQRAGPVGTSPSGDLVATGGANLPGLGEGGREQSQERGVQGRQLTEVALCQALDPTGQGSSRTSGESTASTSSGSGPPPSVPGGPDAASAARARRPRRPAGRRHRGDRRWRGLRAPRTGGSTRPVHAEGIARIEEIDGLRLRVHAIG